MELLYVNFSLGWGGLEMFSADLFGLVTAAGHRAHFLLDGDSPLAERLEREGHGPRLVRRKPSRYLDRRCRRLLRELVDEHGVELVHTFRSRDLFHPGLALRARPDVRLVHHLQMLPGHSRRGLVHRLVYQRVDRVYAITEQIRRRVLELWPVPAESVRTLYYGLDTRPFRTADREAVRARLGIPAGATALGLVGQICEIKGQRFVLEVFADLAAAHPRAVLVLAGAPVRDDPAYHAGLLELVRRRGLAGRVLLPGFQEDVPGVMAALDVFVLGSRNEAFGRVVIEAMAAGCTTVASRAGGVPEIVDDGVDGLLYASRDADDLRAVLERALSLSAAERADLAAAARAKVEERFSMQRFRTRLAEEYADAVGHAVSVAGP